MSGVVRSVKAEDVGADVVGSLKISLGEMVRGVLAAMDGSFIDVNGAAAKGSSHGNLSMCSFGPKETPKSAPPGPSYEKLES